MENEQASDFDKWIQNVAYLTVVGKPFLNEKGEFFIEFTNDKTQEITEISIKVTPSNIVQFPQKKKS